MSEVCQASRPSGSEAGQKSLHQVTYGGPGIFTKTDCISRLDVHLQPFSGSKYVDCDIFFTLGSVFLIYLFYVQLYVFTQIVFWPTESIYGDVHGSVSLSICLLVARCHQKAMLKENQISLSVFLAGCRP